MRDRLVRRFERRLQEGDDALGFWGWTAIVITSLSILTIAIGILLALDHFDNIGTSLVGLVAGLVLLTLTSPGWAGTAAVRRHRKRVARRRDRMAFRLALLDQLFAFGRIGQADYDRNRAPLDAVLQGTGPGDAARVASTWARLVAVMALLTGLLLVGGATTLMAVDPDPDIQAIGGVAVGVGMVIAIAGAGLLTLAIALGYGAASAHAKAMQALEDAYRDLLVEARP